MGLLDDLRKEIEKAIEEARRAQADSGGPPGPVARPRTPNAPKGAASLPAQPVEARPAPPRVEATAPTPPVAAFDLDLTAPPAEGLTFSTREILRALALGEVMDEPKGRRGLFPPHRK